jgi:hypothetical protein
MAESLDVFISWSGQRSKALALQLHDWLKAVVQRANPWMSERDIEVIFLRGQARGEARIIEAIVGTARTKILSARTERRDDCADTGSKENETASKQCFDHGVRPPISAI